LAGNVAFYVRRVIDANVWSRNIGHVCTLVFCLSFLILYTKYESSLSDTCLFSFDDVEYQIIAVNLYHGEGYRIGRIPHLDFFGDNGYKFQRPRDLDKVGSGSYRILLWKNTPLRRYMFKPPGYYLFVYFVYYLFGVHPVAVKFSQMVFISLTASLLPWIGNRYWSSRGVFCGIVAAFLVISLEYNRYPSLNLTRLMAEPFLCFCLLVWALQFMHLEMKETPARTFGLGITSGFILLIKGTTVFIPAVFAVYLLLRHKVNRNSLLLLSCFGLGFILPNVPWEMYINSDPSNLVFHSGIAASSVLDGNNEDSIRTGDWSPEWGINRSSAYLYNRIDAWKHPFSSVLYFMSIHSREIPTLLANKITNAFSVTAYKLSALALLGYYLIAYGRARRFRGGSTETTAKDEKVIVFPLLYLINILGVTLVIFGHPRFIAPFIPFFLLPGVYFILGLFVGEARGEKNKGP